MKMENKKYINTKSRWNKAAKRNIKHYFDVLNYTYIHNECLNNNVEALALNHKRGDCREAVSKWRISIKRELNVNWMRRIDYEMTLWGTRRRIRARERESKGRVSVKGKHEGADVEDKKKYKG